MNVFRRHRASTLGVLAFTAFSLFLTLLVGNTLARGVPSDTRQFTAVFTDASGLAAGDDVHIAGVRVGRVDERRLEDGKAHIVFSVDHAQPVEARTHARVSYLNMLGQRYLALENGTGSSRPLADNAVIGVDHTSPALDLTALFNAFKPLFSALDPKDVNALGKDIIAVTQGEGSTVRHLMTQTASISQHLAGKDEIISQVIDNLTTVMASVSEHREDMTAIVTSLHTLVGSLADDADNIGTAIDSMDRLTTATNGLLTEASEPATEDIANLRTLGDVVAGQKVQLHKAMNDLPNLLTAYTRAMSYGSWLNIYICNLTVKVPGAPLIPLKAGLNSEVCR